MTPTDLQTEITHRTEERLAIMGFTDPKQTPPWASDQAEREANAWARDNHPFDWAQLQKMKRKTI